MKNRSKVPAGRGPWLLTAILLAIVVACSGGDTPGEHRLGLGVYIPATWSEVRQVSGHDVHVIQHQVPCSSCHLIGNTDIGKVLPTRCAACHAEQTRISHAKAQAREQLGDDSASDCTLCHRFTDQPPRGAIETTPAGVPMGPHAHQPGDCKHCHLTQQGDTPGVRVHASQPCLDCHRPHQDSSPKSGECSGCHQDITTAHAAHDKSANEVCTTCHQSQHAGASEALESCVSCHSTHEPIVPPTALFAGGHLECVGCHRPHDFGKEKTAACRSCHENVVMFGSPGIAPHQQCTSCHSPHDVKGSPDQACRRCHADKQPDHPKQGLAGSCVGCHDPHPAAAQAHAKVGPCTSCHQAAHRDSGFHAGVDCKSCHQPHDFVREVSDHRACEACHATQLAKASHLTGHQACEACHRGLPHHPLLPKTGCDTCHARQAGLVNAGHGKCVGCHEPHDGSQSAPCKSCHQREHASAPQGHQACTGCHEAHSGAHPAPCASCHQPQAATPHGRISADCQQCHRPHGPSGVASPPACESCHRRAELPGLHQQDQHAPCSRCHSGHGAVTGAFREGCLSCHQDRKQHFPDAPRCTSCHLFNKNR